MLEPARYPDLLNQGLPDTKMENDPFPPTSSRKAKESNSKMRSIRPEDFLPFTHPGAALPASLALKVITPEQLSLANKQANKIKKNEAKLIGDINTLREKFKHEEKFTPEIEKLFACMENTLVKSSEQVYTIQSLLNLDLYQAYNMVSRSSKQLPSHIKRADVDKFISDQAMAAAIAASEKAFNNLQKEEAAAAKKKKKRTKNVKNNSSTTNPEDELPTALLEATSTPQTNKSLPISPQELSKNTRRKLCQNWIKTTNYSFDPRVKRWGTNNFGKIRGFTDKGLYKYQDRSKEDLKKLKFYHYPIGTEKFLNEIFSFPTETGAGMYCRFKQDGQSTYGVIFFGINENRIYHMFFEEMDEARIKRMDIFTTDNKDFSDNYENVTLENNHEEIVGNYSAYLSKKGNIKIKYPDGNSIKIFLANKDLLLKSI